MDYDNDKYTIKEIVTEGEFAGSIRVVLDCDNSEHFLQGAPMDSADSLKEFVSQYLTDYKSGKRTEVQAEEKVEVSKDIKALLGKEQTATTEE